MNRIFSLLGALTFNQPWVMTGLFALYYMTLFSVSLSQPVAGAIMYFGTSIMNPQNDFPLLSDLPMAKIVAGLCLTACLFNLGKLRSPFSWGFFPMALFILWAVVSALYAQQPALADKRMEEFLKIGLMAPLAAACVRDRRGYGLLFWGVLGSFWYCVLKNLVETQTKSSWYAVHGTGGWIGDSNDWGLALSMALPMFWTAFQLAGKDSLKLRVFHGLTMVSAFLALTLTASRGAFLSTLAALGVLILTEKKRARALAFAAAAALAVSFYMPASYADKMATIFHLSDDAKDAWAGTMDEQSEYTGAERVHFWRVALKMMNDHPWVGVGWGNFVPSFATYSPGEDGAVAHSTWFQIGAEAGVPALIFFLATLMTAMCMALRVMLASGEDAWLRAHSRCLLAGLTAFVVGASFISRENSELLFLYVAMTAILGFLCKKTAPAGEGA